MLLDPDWGLLGATGPILGANRAHTGRNWDKIEIKLGEVNHAECLGMTARLFRATGIYWECMRP